MYKIEKDWITNSGLRAVVLMTRGRHRCHRCGYVALPPGHPLNGVKYDDPCDILQDQHADAMESPIGKRGIIPLVCHGDMPTPDVVFSVHGGLNYGKCGGAYPATSAT